jgi:hypothetical protein
VEGTVTEFEPIEFALYGVTAVLAVLFRYLLKPSNACLVMGKAISDVKIGTGFQDAITPPLSVNLRIATFIAIPAVLGYAAYEFGWGTAGIAFGAFMFVSILVGAVVLPGPESPHFVRLIYGSMVRRYADFEKEGDRVRSAAMKELIARIESQHAAKLTGQS